MRTEVTGRRVLICLALLAMTMAGVPASAILHLSAADDLPFVSAAAGVPAAGCVSDGTVPQAGPQEALPDRAARVEPGEAATVESGGARLTLDAGAVGSPVTVGVSALSAGESPRMEAALTNVTAGGTRGWRFTPDAYAFAAPVEVALPYDPAAVGAAFSPQDVYTYAYDEQAGCWDALERVSVDEEKHLVVSRTASLSVLANAVLTVPESPQAASFNPTQLKDLQAMSAAAGVNLISPPAASGTGEARLAYPIEVPPGRAGMQPQLAVAYDSTGAGSWLGQGWDLQVPSIAVDTRWGVPRYGAAVETETYLVGGEQLAPAANRGPPVARTAEKSFRSRVEGDFVKVVRHGSSPSTYSWETVDKAGTRSFYGGTADSTLRDDAGNAFQWALREVRDKHGNVMLYQHEVQQDTGTANGTVPGRNLYPRKITYTGTGTGSTAEGAYAVSFIRDRDLEEPRRGDVGIDARGGFKRVTADLLRRVEVTMNDLPVRAYELNYTTGVFGKTLLQSIVQFGEDNQPFATHTFAYHDDIRDASGAYRAFTPVGWTSPDDDLGNDAVDAVSGGGEAGAINANTSSSAGGHLYVGYGATASKSGSVGVKTGYNRTSDTGLLALTDVDGDSLPDKVFRGGDGFVFRKNLSRPGGEARFAGEVTPLRNLPGLLGQRSESSTVGVESYVGGAVQLDHVDTFTTTDRYLADVNADGITDVVSGGSVLFGRVGADGVPVYGLSSQTPVPIGSAPVNTTGLLPDLSADREREIDSHPLVDTVRRWVAPYDGTVAVTGGVRLTAAQQPSGEADGVRVAVQHEDAELWSQPIGPADHAEYVPENVGAITVKRGERLYFRVQSRFDGSDDTVGWDPRVTYLGVAAELTDVNGLTPYAYQVSQDFTLGGRASTVTAPVGGTLHLSGTVTKKAATTDDVTAVVTRDGETVFRRTLPAAQAGEIPVELDVAVRQGQQLRWKLSVDSPIDLAQLTWAPRAAYATEPGAPEQVLDAPYDIDMYPADDLTAPQRSWTAPSDGTLTVQPSLTVGSGGAQAVFTVKRRGALLARTTDLDAALTVPVTAGDELFFDFSTRDTGLAARVTGHEVRAGLDPAALETVPSALHSAAVEGAFAQPYRGWGVIGYNGNRERADRPIVQGDLVVDESYREQLPASVDPQEQADEFAADPRVTPPKAFPYTPDPAAGRWAADDTTWAGRTSASSSRLGTTGIAVPTAAELAAGTAVPRVSRSSQVSLTGSVGGPVGSVGGSVATGDSTAEIDYLDLNGDGFPDVVGAAGVQYTEPTGELGGTRAALPDGDVRRTGTSSGNASAGSPARTITTGQGDAAPPAGETANTATAGNDMPPLGVGGNLGSGTSDTAFDLLDINGDGLPDRVYADGRAALNLGYRFAAPEPWPGGRLNDGTTANSGANLGFNTDFYGFAGGASFSVGHSSTRAALLDVTGDGLADRVFDGTPMRVAVNTGSGFAEPQPFLGSSGVNDDAHAELGGGAYTEFSACFAVIFGCVVTNPGVSTGTGIGRTEQILRDINGDGYADQLTSTRDDQLVVAQNTTGRSNLLKSVSRPMGSRIELDYTRDGNTYDQPQSRFVLSKVALYDGHAGDGQDTQLTTYRYSGGVWDRLEREFRGYRTVVAEQRDPAGDGVSRVTTTGYAVDSHYTRGLVTSTRIADGGGHLFTETVNTYQVRDLATGVAFPQVVRNEQRFHEGQEQPRVTTAVEMSYDDVGNMVRSVDLGDTGAADDVETRIRYTYEDQACRTANVLATPKSVDVRGNGVLLRHREATVDCATGDVKQQRATLADGTVAVTDVTYFANGNVQSVTEPANAAGQRYKRTFEYDPALATHVTAVSDSYGYRSTTSYNLKYGLPETVTDTNGQQSRTLYDQLGRVDTVTGPYETGSNHPTVDVEYHPEAAVPYAVTRNVDRNPDGTFRTNSLDTIVFSDGLGRILQTKKDATIAGAEAMIVSGRVEYDHAGRAVARYYPTSEAKGALNTRFSTRADPTAPTRTGYDVLDRATRTVLPDGAATSVSYGFGTDRAGVTRAETAVTDARQATTRTYTDVRLQPTSVQQPGGAWTSYGYDALGQPTSVTDDHNNVTTSTYDNFGRRTSLTTPDGGRTQHAYDLAGNLVRTATATLAARNKAIKYEYEFTRLTAIRYPDSAEADVGYTYGAPGAANNAAGRVTKVDDAAGTVTRGYGPLGELTTETRTVSAGVDKDLSYTTRYQYDTWNRVQRMTYPDGEVLTYHYNHGGLVDGATGVKNNTSYPYLTRLDYDAFEQRTLLETGNGVRTSYTYDTEDRRLASLQAAKADGTTFQNAGYAYDPSGNITSVVTSAPAVDGLGGAGTQTFAYDQLNRLTTSTGSYQAPAGGTDHYELALTYDSLGDVTTKNQTHDLIAADATATPQTDTSYRYAYAYQGSQPHAPSTVGPFTYRYDANGNMVSRSGPGKQKLELDWNDADQLVCSSASGGRTAEEPSTVDPVALEGGDSHECDVSYVYDDQNQRVVKHDEDDNVAVYPNPAYTQRNKSAFKHVFIGETRLVSKLVQSSGAGEAAGEYFFSTDHLGSTAYGTDAGGKVVEHARYLPSGESWAQERSTALPSPYGFNGKELDPETGLYYYGDRYYDPRTTLWQSADPQMGTYLDGGPAGGVGNPVTLATYTYAANNPVRLTDPDGRWVNIAAGAAIGAVISAGMEGINQYSAGEFSARKLLGAAAGGAVSGAIGGATLGAGLLVEGGVAVGAGVAEGVVTRAVSGEPTTAGAVVADAAGAVVGQGVLKAGEGAVKAVGRYFGKGATAAAGEAAEHAPAPAGRASSCHSFAAGTRVLRGDGTEVAIEELEPGDTVVATDPLTGESTVRTIVVTHLNTDSDQADVTVVDGDGTVSVLRTTQHHPFWAGSRGAWVQAADLRPGELLRSADGTRVTVREVLSYTTVREMYDLTVDTVHSYYVVTGDEAVLVHNINTPTGCGPNGEPIYDIPAGSKGGPGAGERIRPQDLADYNVGVNADPSLPTPLCSYCRHNEAEAIDHVIARKFGGDLTDENLTPACWHCNSSKREHGAPLNPPAGYVGPWPPSHWPPHIKR